MENGHFEQGRARDALSCLDAGCSRGEWIRLGMAAKAAGLSFEDFHLWSQNAPNYKGERDCLTAWNSFDDGPITESTLFRAARDAGWQGLYKAPRNGVGTIHALIQRPKEQAEPQVAPKVRIDPVSAFDAYPSAPAEHPYIVAKRGTADGLRIVPIENPLAIRGRSVAGYLAVPVRSLDGELRTVQYIPPPGAGEKLNAPGASFGSGMFVVGEVSADGRIYICEGIGHAWAVARADYQAAAVVTFGAGRFRVVGQALRERYPDARLVFVADRGKEAEAEGIARELCGSWVVAMPGDKPPNYDANDYELEHGTEALESLLQAAKAPPMHYQLQSGADLMDVPMPRWLVRGVLPADALAALFGPSGSGKSFIALDLCAAIADGAPEWFGRRVTGAPVTYCALEGARGLQKRIHAWTIRHHRPLPARLRFITQGIDLRNQDDIADLAAAVVASSAGDGLLVLDTLNRAAPGADENSSRDMGDLIEGAKELQRRIGGVVLLVHHTGKDGTKGLRGHSSLYAALDVAIEVSRTDSRREWSIAKSKDDEDGARAAFVLRVVELGSDPDGDPVTSCIVEPDGATAADTVQRLKLPQGSNQKIAYQAIGELLRHAKDFDKGGAPNGRPCIQIDSAFAAVAARMPCAEESRRYVARRAVTAMVGNGIYQVREGWLWHA